MKTAKREREKERIHSQLREYPMVRGNSIKEMAIGSYCYLIRIFILNLCRIFIRSCHSQQMLNVHLCFEMNGDVTFVTDSIEQR